MHKPLEVNEESPIDIDTAVRVALQLDHAAVIHHCNPPPFVGRADFASELVKLSSRAVGVAQVRESAAGGEPLWERIEWRDLCDSIAEFISETACLMGDGAEGALLAFIGEQTCGREVHGCRTYGETDGGVEQVSDEHAEFWTVYRRSGEGIEAIEDFTTRAEAVRFVLGEG